MSDTDTTTGNSLASARGEQASPLTVIDSVAPQGWRAKAAKVVAQLIAGSSRGSEVWAGVKENLDVVEGRSAVNKALANAVAQQAIADPETMERAKARFLGQFYKKNENFEAVIGCSSEELKRLPPPKDSAQVDSDQSALGESDRPLDEDWAATFVEYAEKANSGDLRQRLGRVLAGEIAQTGLYPRDFIRKIYEADKYGLEALRAIGSYVVGKDILVVKGSSDTSISNFIALVDAGFAAETSSMLSKTWSSTDKKITILGNQYAANVILTETRSIKTSIVSLTRAGGLALDLMGWRDERRALERLLHDEDKSSISTAAIGQIIEVDGRYKLNDIKIVYNDDTKESAT